jgi:hypothetical protein
MWLTGILGNIIAPSKNCGYAGTYLFGEIHPDLGEIHLFLIYPYHTGKNARARSYKAGVYIRS